MDSNESSQCQAHDIKVLVQALTVESGSSWHRESKRGHEPITNKQIREQRRRTNNLYLLKLPAKDISAISLYILLLQSSDIISHVQLTGIHVREPLQCGWISEAQHSSAELGNPHSLTRRHLKPSSSDFPAARRELRR